MQAFAGLYCIIALAIISRYSRASTPTAVIKGRLILPDDTPLNSTLVSLNGGEYFNYTVPDGSFTFHNVQPGVHLLDVHNREYLFSQVKFQLLEDSMDAPKCFEYVYPGAQKQAIPHPLLLTAHAKFDYFEPRPGFSIFSILKNPMLLMMMFSVVLMIFMPKMMENLDPEQKEQMKKQMEMQQDPTKMLSQLWGDLSGSNNNDSAAATKKIKRDKPARRLKRE